MKPFKIMIFWVALLCVTSFISPHHFKGLPHYSYFENYPQTPIDEYLGQAENYEFYLVIYDFQGLTQTDMAQPEDARLFINAYDLRAKKAYGGPLLLEILDGDEPIHDSYLKSSEQEFLYQMNRILPDAGDYSLRITLYPNNESDSPDAAFEGASAVIPFKLTSQKISWGKWLGIALGALVIVAAFGARKARVMKDKKADQKRAKAGSPA